MERKLLISNFLFFLLFTCGILYDLDAQVNQEKEIVGVVTALSDHTPLMGVNVLIKNSSTGVTTDFDGHFKLMASPTDVLIFSYIGFVTQEVVVGEKVNFSISLEEDLNSLEEVVVVGYGTQKKVNLTGSVSSLSSEEIEDRPITQASQALSGLVSGVSVQQGSGRPGGDGASIIIRGMGTFSGAGNEPLVLIDGLAASLNDIDPNNIKNISVLKDAASASIYGTRAANGVILVETKRGRKGKMSVQYSGYVGWQEATELPEFLESAGYAKLRNEANSNQGSAPAYTEQEIGWFASGEKPDEYPNVPHLKNLLNSGSGLQTNHNISITGGDDKNSYLFSLGYLKQEGLVEQNTYDKYNFLLNFDSELQRNLNLKVNLTGFSSGTDEPRQYDGDLASMINFAVRQGPIYPGIKSDGTYGYQDNYSPEAWLDSDSFTNIKNKYFLGGAELKWDFLENFSLSGKVGYKYFNYINKSFASTFVFDDNKSIGPNNLNVNAGYNSLITLQSLLEYSNHWGNHSFDALAGISQEEFHEEYVTGFRDNFPNNLIHEINAGSPSNQQSSGSAAEWGLRSFFGRLNYDYKERYLFEANGRYDGTSRFPEKGRWGFFPSFSAGWRITKEPFMQDRLEWIYNLKVRASWGVLGNQNIGNYPYQNVLSLGHNYPFGGNLTSGARLTNLSNSDITWETTTVTDLGVDLSLFKGQLEVVFDYFDKTTDDILYQISVSNVLGLAPPVVNAGKVNNKGFEIYLNYKTSIGGVHIGVAPNFSYTKNRVEELVNGLDQDIGRGLFVGHTINSTYGYVADGLFVDQADVDSYPTQPYAAEPGFIRYKDISGPNGVPDGVVDPTYDRKVIGSYYPKYNYGLTIAADYKGFDFSAILQGLGGYHRQIGSYQAFAFYNGGQIQQWQANNRWNPENPDPNAEYIKLTSLNQGSGTIMSSTYWDRNASFLRVKNVQIGYSFGDEVLELLHLSKLRVYFSGQNLFNFKSFYKGWDPEMSQSAGDNSPFYPITSVYTFGMNLNF